MQLCIICIAMVGDSLKTIQTYARVADEDLNNMNSAGQAQHSLANKLKVR